MLWWNVQRLRSKSSQTRSQAVDAMAATGNAQNLSHICDALKDDSAEVRLAAVRGLVVLKNEKGMDALLSAVEDKDKAVRAEAAQALRLFNDPRAIKVLVGALSDGDHNVRWQSVQTLSALGWRPETDAEYVMRAVAMGQPEDAASYGGAAVDALANMLQDKTGPNRRSVAAALGRTQDEKAVKPLVEALKDEDSGVRFAAVESLAQLGHASSTDAILPLLRDVDPRVRTASLEGLAKMGDARIVEVIAQYLLRDESWDVRKTSVESLGRVRHERVTELLCLALQDQDYDVRQAAAKALGQNPDARAIGPLILSLTDENSAVRQTAKAALCMIDRQWELSTGAECTMKPLEERVKNRDYWVSHSATDTLAKISDARQRHKELAKQVDPEKERRNLAIGALSGMLRDADRDFRQAAAEAMGRITDIGVVGHLVASLDDDDEWVGRAAALALNHLNWQPGPQDGKRAEKMKSLMMKM